jgi:hypothetical protein
MLQNLSVQHDDDDDEFWWGNLRERDQLEDKVVDGRIILPWTLKK